MSNWYKESQSMYQTHDRFFYNIQVAVWVPQGQGQEDGYQILVERLKRMVGPTEFDTPGSDANITVENISQS